MKTEKTVTQCDYQVEDGSQMEAFFSNLSKKLVKLQLQECIYSIQISCNELQNLYEYFYPSGFLGN